MKEVEVKDKQQYFNEHYPFTDPPELADRKECIHCGEIIIVGNFKVYKDDTGFEFICCPNAPECDGTVIDWLPVGE
jgi:hypothetical protein